MEEHDISHARGRFIWDLLDSVIPGIMIGLIVLGMIVEVIARTFFSYSFVWLVEGVSLTFVWVVFLAGAGSYRFGRAIVVESLVIYLPAQVQRWLLAIALLLTMGVAAFLTYVGIGVSFIMAPQNTTILNISLAWETVALPVGMALITLYATRNLIDFLRRPGGVVAPESRSHTAESEG
jgi:TRAP-type C4-dicarboxylate transport system permease small subunit